MLFLPKQIQICFNVSVPNRLYGVMILKVPANEQWKIFIGFARNAETMSLLKASINIWNEDISSDADNKNMWSEFEHDLELLESDIDSCMLDEEGVD